jgi:hypothetical protein
MDPKMSDHIMLRKAAIPFEKDMIRAHGFSKILIQGGLRLIKWN